MSVGVDFSDALFHADDAPSTLKIQAPKQPVQFKLQRWKDIKAEAATQIEEWLVPHWIEFGSLAMLTGNPFAGKSHLLCELIAGLAHWGTFGRYQVKPCAVVILDCENKTRITKNRVELATEGNEAGLDNHFARVDLANLLLPFAVDEAPEILRQLIQQTKKEFNTDRVFVIIDTLRSTIDADEMDAKEMRKVLYPLQRVAVDEQAAVLILHHRPKNGSGYSGGSTIPAALDYMWLWEVDKDSRIGKLSLQGTRGTNQDAMCFKLEETKTTNPDGSENVLKSRNVFQANMTAATNKAERARVAVRECLVHGALNKTELVKNVRNRWTQHNDKETLSKEEVHSILDDMVFQSHIKETIGAKNAITYSLAAAP